MSVTRLAALAFVLLGAATAAAQPQPPAKNGFLPDNWLPDNWQKSVPLPPDFGGQVIAEGDQVWAYVAVVLGFLFVFVFARVAVRVLAYIAYVLLVIGGIGLLCSLLSDGLITTWKTLAITTAAVGGYCGVTSVIVGLFTMDQDQPQPAGTGGLGQEVTAQRAELDRLSRELEDLREKLGRANRAS